MRVRLVRAIAFEVTAWVDDDGIQTVEFINHGNAGVKVSNFTPDPILVFPGDRVIYEPPMYNGNLEIEWSDISFELFEGKDKPLNLIETKEEKQ